MGNRSDLVYSALAIIFGIGTVVVYLREGWESPVFPIFIVLALLFSIMLMFSDLEFKGEE